MMFVLKLAWICFMCPGPILGLYILAFYSWLITILIFDVFPEWMKTWTTRMDLK